MVAPSLYIAQAEYWPDHLRSNGPISPQSSLLYLRSHEKAETVAQMDGTLWGVIIGGITTIAGSFLSQWWSTRREEKQWERERNASLADEERDEKRKAKLRKVKLYGECQAELLAIASLSTKATLGSDAQVRLRTHATEARRCFSLLLSQVRLTHGDQANAYSRLAALESEPRKAVDLLEMLDNMIAQDSDLPRADMRLPGAKLYPESQK